MPLADLLSSDDEMDAVVGGDESQQVSQVLGDFDYLVTKGSLDDVGSVRQYSVSLLPVKKLLGELDDGKASMDPSILSSANKVVEEARQEANSIYTFIKLNYKPVWPGLDGLIRHPANFAHVISLVGQDVTSVASAATQSSLETFLKRDEVLGLSMSASVLAKQQGRSPVRIDEHRMQLVLEACELLQELAADRQRLAEYVAGKARVLSPNVAAIVGPTACAQILSIYGLDGLCKTPACNLPSLGVNNSSTGLRGGAVRNKGYLYQSPLVQSVPEEYRKQALRLVAAKVALAARMDYAGRGDLDKSSEFGDKCYKEIAAKLDKLQTPPENQRVKPLAKPIDKKSAKRGGRRFRKQKERMRMSEVEKAQNRVVFGSHEETRMDAFGEEIGLGMVGKSGSGVIGSYRSLQASSAHKPQMSKEMQKRLQAPQKFGGTPTTTTTKLSKLLEDETDSLAPPAKRVKSDSKVSAAPAWLNPEHKQKRIEGSN